ncbi:GWxTD domain-containing protein, partial [bacterium]|nr:GWxTD domain-containing protein [bacterium]
MNISHKLWMLVALLAGLVLSPAPSATAAENSTQLTGADREYRNTLLALGDRQLKSGQMNEALDTFTQLLERLPNDAIVYTRIGHVYLKKQEWDLAKESFETAQNLDKTLVEAYVGLGLVYAESPAKGMSAYYNFRKAVGEAKRATKLDPNYGPAYRLLGEAYERFQEEHEKAVGYFMRYIELEPDNPDGLFYFGLAAVQAKDFEKINDHIRPYSEANPEEIKLIPLVAQGHFYKERFELALENFERFLQNVDGRERQLFTDITNVASEKELVAFKATAPGPERQAYLEQFWSRRDPDILTNINERIIEHYRRVWYARTFFSENQYPWDKRGEIYIRYGAPDYRSRSNQRNFIQSPEVEAVRTKMAVDIYGPMAAFLTFTGPVFPIRTRRIFDPQDQTVSSDIENIGESPAVDSGEGGEADFDDDGAVFTAERGARFDRDPYAQYDDENSEREFYNHRIRLQFGGHAPVTIDNEAETVPWETWTYTQISGGIEITFTDEMSSGVYAYAPLPDGQFEDAEALRYLARMTEHAPEVIVQRATSESPDYYRPGAFGPALNFYYDLADFQSIQGDGQTKLEVYYGIPPEQVEMEEHADSAIIHVKCALALADEDHTTVYRSAQEFVYAGLAANFGDTRGSFVPEILTTEVPPGKYELQIQVKDMVSGRTGLYKQSLEISDYSPDQLHMSHIQLGSEFQYEGKPKFQKGDIWIIPMPTRTYGERQKVYAYFELYNLNKNQFGQTSYKTQYNVRSSSLPSIGVFGAVSSGFKALFRNRKPSFSIETEHTGSDTDVEAEYVEIDLEKAKPGVNALEIRITDLVTSQEVSREVKF